MKHVHNNNKSLCKNCYISKVGRSISVHEAFILRVHRKLSCSDSDGDAPAVKAELSEIKSSENQQGNQCSSHSHRNKESLLISTHSADRPACVCAGRKWTADGSGLISPAGQVEVTSRAAR